MTPNYRGYVIEPYYGPLRNVYSHRFYRASDPTDDGLGKSISQCMWRIDERLRESDERADREARERALHDEAEAVGDAAREER